MFTLVKREIRDNIAFFIGAALLAGIVIGVSISIIYQDFPRDQTESWMSIIISVMAIVTLGFFVMGATQMYTDRSRRISAFVSTLPANRRRILSARMIVGILAILTLVVPLAVTATILLRLFMPPIPMYSGIVRDIFTVTFLTAFACYCIGLQTGWNPRGIASTLSGLGLTCLLASLILIKGFGLHILVILVLFIVASIVRTWHMFKSTSL